MSRHVKLSDIIDGMQFQSPERAACLNRTTGEVIPMTDDLVSSAEDDEDADKDELVAEVRKILDGDPNYLPLPDRFEIDEYRMMERFSGSVEDPKTRDMLGIVIQGSGAFRRFKDTLHHFGIAERWYNYRDEAYKEIAVEWCEHNHIEYTDDFPVGNAEQKETE